MMFLIDKFNKKYFWNKLFLNLINVLNEEVVNYVDKSIGKKISF